MDVNYKYTYISIILKSLCQWLPLPSLALLLLRLCTESRWDSWHYSWCCRWPKYFQVKDLIIVSRWPQILWLYVLVFAGCHVYFQNFSCFWQVPRARSGTRFFIRSEIFYHSKVMAIGPAVMLRILAMSLATALRRDWRLILKFSKGKPL